MGHERFANDVSATPQKAPINTAIAMSMMETSFTVLLHVICLCYTKRDFWLLILL